LNDALKSEDPVSIAGAISDLLAADPANIQALEVGLEIAKYNKAPELMRQMFDMVPMSGLSGDKAEKFASMLISDSSFTYRYPEAAMKFAEYAFKKDPENSGYINTYARLLYCLGDLEDALTWQEKAVKLDPNNKTYQDNLNYCISIKTLRPGNKKN